MSGLTELYYSNRESSILKYKSARVHYSIPVVAVSTSSLGTSRSTTSLYYSELLLVVSSNTSSTE